MSLSEKLSVDRMPTARLGYNGENYARIVNFGQPAGLFCETFCFGVPVALRFVQVLLSLRTTAFWLRLHSTLKLADSAARRRGLWSPGFPRWTGRAWKTIQYPHFNNYARVVPS